MATGHQNPESEDFVSSSVTPLGVGIVGAGVISDEYLKTLTAAIDVDVRFVADLDTERARQKAALFDVPGSGTYEELLADPSVQLVVNLTVPAAHAAVTAAALESGRHVWSEKPLATSLADAQRLVSLAERAGLRLGCAPDTVLGRGTQAALEEVAAGRIGRPMTGFASTQYRGPDFWHPSPEFLFAEGAGPVLDVGPYAVTTLVLVFGAVRQVTARGVITRPRRRIASGPKAGQEFDVSVPTHVVAIYEFVGGGVVDAVFSVDSAIERSTTEIAGTEGAMVLPAVSDFEAEGVAFDLAANATSISAGSAGGTARGAGVVDLIRSLRAGQPHRADGQLALHVLETLLATEQSVQSGATVPVHSHVVVPALLPSGWSTTA